MCAVCHKNPCDPRCPNYEEPDYSKYCSVCCDGISEGERYIENQYGEFVHYDCISGLNWLLDWLDCEIKED